MSRVYFHSPSGEVGLLGSERAHCRMVVRDIATGVLDAGRNQERLTELLPPGHDLRNSGNYSGMGFARGYELMLDWGFGDESLIQWRGRNIEAFATQLNTALLVGNDVIRLMARLHGQCELHAWVDGPDRAWLAQIIEQGRSCGLLRPLPEGFQKNGWDDVAELLYARDDEPVVMSYSVSEHWPQPCYLLDDDKPEFTVKEGDEFWELLDKWWCGLPAARHWELCMKWLRAQEAMDLQLRPDKWAWPDWHYGHGLTLFDLLAPDYQRRLDEAFDLTPVGT